MTSFQVKDTRPRAEYVSHFRDIGINRNKSTTLLEKRSDKIFTDNQKFLSIKNVAMHKFEHEL